jgi:hypothetical protein
VPGKVFFAEAKLIKVLIVSAVVRNASSLYIQRLLNLKEGLKQNAPLNMQRLEHD